MEGDTNKVFVTGITRNNVPLSNNLYDVLKREVIKPTTITSAVQDECEFQPNCQKNYVPKKRSKLKVITVRDIRNLFERDNFENLSFDLERQQQYLLRKIRDGNSNDESTKKIALNLLRSDKPVSRNSWQILMNINPEGHTHSSQFILCDGKCIQINGSKGGKNKFLCNFDVKKFPESSIKTRLKAKLPTRKRALLRDSLNIKFKPGPLRKKKDLDYSYQKYNVGNIKLINLPNIALLVQPSYGKALEPTISKFLQSVLAKDGTISEKWAEFSASVSGKVSEEGVQICEDNSVAINLSYKYDQKLMLMRDANEKEQNADNSNMCNNIETLLTDINTEIIDHEIKSIVTEMLDCLEISFNQDSMYTGVDEPREITDHKSKSDATVSNVKEKEKKRKYCELDRLDVTIIRISEKRRKNNAEPCSQSFCSLGCVCESLECEYQLKDHCSRTDCMFGCNCDFTKFKMTESLQGNCSEFIPGLYYLDKKINDKLSKEEQKFHQTVIVTEDKSILLKSRRRNWKTSKKYADFYSNMPLRSEINNQKFPSIIVKKLKCENIEPWCMVHNLYKCFCKGKFTQRYLDNTPALENNTSTISYSNDGEKKVVEPIENKTAEPPGDTKTTENVVDTIVIDGENDALDILSARRVLPYEGRNYSDIYYRRTNEKIFEMEKNDKKLHSKMIALLTGSEENTQKNENGNSNKKIFDVANAPFKLDELLDNIVQERGRLMDGGPDENVVKTNKTCKVNFLPNKLKLGEWLEISYKKYKEQIDKGDCKISLSPPSPGKCALYPWEFILSRYQQRKNLFLISIEKPYRIFMAVDAKHPFFERCVNVTHIPESSLREYPIMVHYLRNNVKDLKDNFCILCGLSHCWELIGSVNKVNENKNTITLGSGSNLERDLPNVKTIKKMQNVNVQNVISDVISNPDLNKTQSPELSKWFVMTVEKDFNEIQFYNKCFYVKYDSIMKSIDVARRVGKTVRLSTQKCQENSNNSWPQFGIYAAPDNKENSVFIGPYENDEPLGIETVRESPEVTSVKRTRGSWISVNKVDNLKVIDNPLSYIPSNNDESIETLDSTTGSDSNKSKDTSSLSENCLRNESSPLKDSNTADKTIKLLKPIKIRKTNGFYQIAPQSILKSLKFKKCLQQSDKLPEAGGGTPSSSKNNTFQTMCNLMPQFKQLKNIPKNQPNKPVAEIAPLIKVTNIGSLCSKNTSAELSINERKAKGGGMFVLKPDEINERLVASNYFRIMQPTDSETTTTDTRRNSTRDNSSLDIEEFLDTSIICSAPAADVYVISDDEDDPESPIRDVWIVCENISSIGWILGRKNNENKLSFEFPGFAFSNFYDEGQAFNKINQVFSRKVYVPKHVTMKWRVIEKDEDLHGRCKLQQDDLKPHHVLTKQGLMHKDNLFVKNIKTERKMSYDSTTPTQSIEDVDSMEVLEITENEVKETPTIDSMDTEVDSNMSKNNDDSDKISKARRQDCAATTTSTEKAKDATKEIKTVEKQSESVSDGSVEVVSEEAMDVIEADETFTTIENTCNEKGLDIEIVTSLKVEKLNSEEDQVLIELE